MKTYEGLVILGAPRSGTTLLRRLLNAHPQVACPGETNLLAACARFLHGETTPHGVEFGVVAGLRSLGIEEPALLERMRDFALGFLRDYAQAQGKPVWAEKSAFSSFHLDEVERLIGEHARFIVIVRHGLDVVCSLDEFVDKVGGFPPDLHDYVRNHPYPHEAYAAAWRDLTNALFDFTARHSENAHQLRYEDLVEDPEAEMRSLCEFAELPWEDSLIAQALAESADGGFGDWKTYARNSIDDRSVGRWQSLPDPMIRHLAGICNDTLERCGYDPVHADQSASDAGHRYELGMLLQRLKSGDSGASEPQE